MSRTKTFFRKSLLEWEMRRAFFVLACLCLSGPVHAEQQDPFVVLQNPTRGQINECYSNVEKGLTTIPRDIRAALMSAGYSVVISPTMISGAPEVDGGIPRGWSEDSNWDNVGGIFQPRYLRVVIPETVQSKDRSGKYVPNKRAEKTIRHEIGHAYDYYQGQISQSPDFNDAYVADFDHLRTDQQTRFHYYCQPNGAGNSELFAELFAAAYTPDANSDSRFADLLTAFPKTTQYILRLSPNKAKWNAPKKQEPELTKQVDASEPTTTSSSSTTNTSMNNGLNRQYEAIIALYRQNRLAEAEPLMRVYAQSLEKSGAGSDRINETYRSYAALLRKLHKDAQAREVEASIAKRAASIPKRDVGKAANDAPEMGVVGLKFVIENGLLPKVNIVFADTPAAKAGIQPGDVIAQVDGEALEPGITRDSVYQLIIGEPGSKVSITVLRNGSQRFTFNLIRMSSYQIIDSRAGDGYRRRD